MRLTLGINNCFAVRRWPRAVEWARVVRDELGLETVQHTLDLFGLDPDPGRAGGRGAGRLRGPRPDDPLEPARLLEALAGSGAEEMALILEIIPASEADDRRVLEELRQSVEYWREALGEAITTSGSPARA